MTNRASHVAKFFPFLITSSSNFLPLLEETREIKEGRREKGVHPVARGDGGPTPHMSGGMSNNWAPRQSTQREPRRVRFPRVQGAGDFDPPLLELQNQSTRRVRPLQAHVAASGAAFTHVQRPRLLQGPTLQAFQGEDAAAEQEGGGEVESVGGQSDCSKECPEIVGL